MDRTPEQVKADEDLTSAIEGVIAAYGTSPEGLLTGYVVLTAHQGIEDSGTSNTTFNWFCKDDGMPWHHIYGIMEMGRYIIDETRTNAYRAPGEPE